MLRFIQGVFLLALSMLTAACALITDYDQDQGAKVSRLGQVRVQTAVLNVRGFSPDYRRLGLDGNRLRQELAAKLRHSGIELVDMQQAISRPEAVLIDVSLVAKQNTTSGIYSYAASVKVWEKLTLTGDDDSSFTSLPIWRDGLNGIFQDSDVGKLQAVYLHLVERFIADNSTPAG